MNQMVMCLLTSGVVKGSSSDTAQLAFYEPIHIIGHFTHHILVGYQTYSKFDGPHNTHPIEFVACD